MYYVYYRILEVTKLIINQWKITIRGNIYDPYNISSFVTLRAENTTNVNSPLPISFSVMYLFVCLVILQ